MTNEQRLAVLRGLAEELEQGISDELLHRALKELVREAIDRREQTTLDGGNM